MWCTNFYANNLKKCKSGKRADSLESGWQNIEKRQKKSVTGISLDPQADLLPTEYHDKSAITDHICQNNHAMNWEASEIVERESDNFKR